MCSIGGGVGGWVVGGGGGGGWGVGGGGGGGGGGCTEFWFELKASTVSISVLEIKVPLHRAIR